MSSNKVNVLKKLYSIQKDLKAPKGKTNTFAHFKYRSCEDILELLKPLMKEKTCVVTLSDEIVSVGERNYIKATATILDVHTGESYSVDSYARESVEKKGMDDAQQTGSTSSYARKYALSGLFAIDDNKDIDAEDNSKK